MWSAFPQSPRQGQVTRLAGSAAHHGPFWRNTRLHPHRPHRLARAARVGWRAPCASVEPLSTLARGSNRVRGHLPAWTPWLPDPVSEDPAGVRWPASVPPSVPADPEVAKGPVLPHQHHRGPHPARQPCTHPLVGGPSLSCRAPD